MQIVYIPKNLGESWKVILSKNVSYYPIRPSLWPSTCGGETRVIFDPENLVLRGLKTIVTLLWIMYALLKEI